MGRVDERAAIAYLESFHDMEREPGASANPPMGLASMRALLRRLGDPQRGRPTAHVTGTNGKGSVAAMIEGALRAAGARTALFTSPHLHSWAERIRFDGAPVPMTGLAAGVRAMRPALDAEQAASGGAVSTFGALTALFFLLARERGADWQVTEVGLGGSFDATNVHDEGADLAVVTPVALDHTAVLGGTVEAIARDKAGIVGPRSTCVLAPQPHPAAAEVVRARCRETGAALVSVADQWEAEPLARDADGQTFRLRGPDGTRELRTPLAGAHQLVNAATAAAAIHALRARGEAIPDEALARGIAGARVAGRLETLARAPLVVADGAHNPAAAAALAAALRDGFAWRRCFLVLGVMADKDLRGMGEALAGLAHGIWCCALDSPRARDPASLADALRPLGAPVAEAASVAEGIACARAAANADDLICVAGSLRAVADARVAALGADAAAG